MKKKKVDRRSSENQVEVTLLYETFTLLRKTPFVRVSLSLYQEEKDDSKTLESLVNGDGKDLLVYLYNNLTLVYCVLPDNLL